MSWCSIQSFFYLRNLSIWIRNKPRINFLKRIKFSLNFEFKRTYWHWCVCSRIKPSYSVTLEFIFVSFCSVEHAQNNKVKSSNNVWKLYIYFSIFWVIRYFLFRFSFLCKSNSFWMTLFDVLSVLLIFVFPSSCISFLMRWPTKTK